VKGCGLLDSIHTRGQYDFASRSRAACAIEKRPRQSARLACAERGAVEILMRFAVSQMLEFLSQESGSAALAR
jgi:hypothetical protein